MGTGEIGLPVLRWLASAPLVELVAIVTQPDKPVGRSQILMPPAAKALAITLNLPVLQPQKVRRSEELDRIATLRPDLIVVMAYGQILPKALLEMPAYACLNLHASILPRHRGAAPIQAGEERLEEAGEALAEQRPRRQQVEHGHDSDPCGCQGSRQRIDLPDGTG